MKKQTAVLHLNAWTEVQKWRGKAEQYFMSVVMIHRAAGPVSSCPVGVRLFFRCASQCLHLSWFFFFPSGQKKKKLCNGNNSRKQNKHIATVLLEWYNSYLFYIVDLMFDRKDALNWNDLSWAELLDSQLIDFVLHYLSKVVHGAYGVQCLFFFFLFFFYGKHVRFQRYTKHYQLVYLLLLRALKQCVVSNFDWIWGEKFRQIS